MGASLHAVLCLEWSCCLNSQPSSKKNSELSYNGDPSPEPRGGSSDPQLYQNPLCLNRVPFHNSSRELEGSYSVILL